MEHLQSCGRSSCARRAVRRCRPNPIASILERWFPQASAADRWREREACEAQHSQACERAERPRCEQDAQEYCAAAFSGPVLTDSQP